MSLSLVFFVQDVAEPEFLLAAGILALAVEDLDRKTYAADARRFLKSKWCGALLQGFDVDFDELTQRLERHEQQKSIPYDPRNRPVVRYGHRMASLRPRKKRCPKVSKKV